VPPIGTHNNAAVCREKYAALVVVSRKLNTAAKEVYYDVDNINAKKKNRSAISRRMKQRYGSALRASSKMAATT
jgi:hypothetical protein